MVRNRVLIKLACTAVMSAAVFTLLGLARRAGANVRPEILYSTKDLPEHGITLIAPSDAAFDGLFRKLPSRYTADEALRAFTVFVENRSPSTVVAYALDWELTDSAGQTKGQISGSVGATLLMEHYQTAPLGDGMTIPPGSAPPAFFESPGPQMREPAPGGGTAGEARSSLGNQEGGALAAPANTHREALRLELARHLAARRESTVAITVSLDGAFLDDGSFVGPDTSGFFEKIKANCDARRDLYTSFLANVAREQRRDAALDHLRKLSDPMSAENTALAKSSGQDYVAAARMMYARELVRLWDLQGPDKAIELIRSRVEKPWAQLRKQ
ncbi:MAG TPA: hypothetical protein VJX67_20915 [Blastocatellia bacterium]|nr:hypothetical protein [Blastocatellia bacterium]